MYVQLYNKMSLSLSRYDTFLYHIFVYDFYNFLVYNSNF